MASKDRYKKIKEALRAKSSEELIQRAKLIDRLKWICFFLLMMTAAAVLFFLSKGVDPKKILPLSFFAFVLVIGNFKFGSATKICVKN